MAIGAYEDDCHNTPKRLPFGFETFNIPSMEEVAGEQNVSSMTWVNNEHGTSTHEEKMLDQIVTLEESEDEVVVEPDSKTDHIENKDFIDIKIDIEVNTPLQAPKEPETKPVDSRVKNTVNAKETE